MYFYYVSLFLPLNNIHWSFKSMLAKGNWNFHLKLWKKKCCLIVYGPRIEGPRYRTQSSSTITSLVCLFVCWRFGGFRPSRDFFHSFGDITITDEEIQIYVRHSLPLSSEVSLACHNVTRANSLWWSSPRTRDTHNFCHTFDSGAVTTCFNDLGLSRLGIEPQYPACEVNAETLRHLFLR